MEVELILNTSKKIIYTYMCLEATSFKLGT